MSLRVVLYTLISLSLALGELRPPIITEHPSSIIVPKNEPITINCKADGYPEPDIHWYKDGQKVQTQPTHPQSHRVLLPNGSLFFLSVMQTSHDQDGGVYWCEAVNAIGRARSMNATLDVAGATVDGSGGEPDFLPGGKNVTTVPEGRDVVLSCSVRNLGSHKVAWFHYDRMAVLTLQDKVMTGNPRIGVSHDGVGVWNLNIKDVKRTDEGRYMCTINTDPAKTWLVKLHVEVPPRILDNLSSSNMVQKEGANVSLECVAEGSPEPIIVWRRNDGKPINLSKNESVKEVVGPMLKLWKVSRMDMGAYLCSARNGVAPAASKQILLGIDFPPMLRVPEQLIAVYDGDSATLNCFVEAHQPYLNYWEKDGMIIHPSDKFMMSQLRGPPPYKVNMSLVISRVDKQDFGKYKCVAKSSRGQTDGTITLYGSVIPEEADSDDLYKTVNSYLANPVAAASALGLTRVKQREDEDTFHFEAAGVEVEFAYHKKGSPLDGGKLSVSFEKSAVAMLFPWLSGLLRTQLLKVKVSIDISNIRAWRNGYFKVELGYELYYHIGSQKGLITISRDYDSEDNNVQTIVEHTVGVYPPGGPQLIPNFLVTVDSDHLTLMGGKFVSLDGVVHYLNGTLDLEKKQIILNMNYQNANYTLNAQASKDHYPDLGLSVSKGSTELFSIQALAETPQPDLVNYDLTFTVHGCFEDKLKISWETKQIKDMGRYGLLKGKFNLHLLSQYGNDYTMNTTAEITPIGIRLATVIAVDGSSKIDNVLVFQNDNDVHDYYPGYAFSMVTILYDQYDDVRGIFHEINGNITMLMVNNIPYMFPYFRVAFDSSFNGKKALMFSMDTLAFPYSFDLEIHDRPDIPGYFLPLPFPHRLKVTQKVGKDSELKTLSGFYFHLNVDNLLFNISGIVNEDDDNGGKGKVVLKNDWSRNDYSEGLVLQVEYKTVDNFCLTATIVSRRNGQLMEEYGLEFYQHERFFLRNFELTVFKKDEGNILLQESIHVRGKLSNNLYGTEQADIEIVYQPLYHQEKGKMRMKISAEYSMMPSVRLTLQYQTDSSSPMMAIIEYQKAKQTGMAKYDFSVICFDPSNFFDLETRKIEIMGSLEKKCINQFNNVKLLVKVNDHSVLKAVHESEAGDDEAADNADMYLVYGPNKADLQHGGNSLWTVGHAGHSAALGIFDLSGNRSLSALAGWQPTDDRQEYQLNIKGSVARNLEPLEVGLQILQQNITDLNKTQSTVTSLCFGISGLDSPILLETPPIDLQDVYYDVYHYIRDQLQYKDLPYSLRHHIENIYWKFYYLYWKIKYEIVEMLSEPTSPACINNFDSNSLDNDDNGDGVFDEYDPDDNNDGVPDHEDADDDNDGIRHYDNDNDGLHFIVSDILKPL